MSDCLFCQIIAKKVAANIAYENEELIAFHDINPQAPEHILIIPKKHIATIDEIEPTDAQLLGNMILCAKKLASNLGLSDKGYRLVFNVNQHGGQEIYHIHLHLLGGRQLSWPPG